MRRLAAILALAGLLAAPSAAPARTPAQPRLPYKASQWTMRNGLRVIVVPTGVRGLVSLHIPVRVGSRNEVEPGRSGFAHFFEHILFKGSEAIPEEARARTIAESGAAQNAFTTLDFTNYHTTFLKRDLEKMIALEADRFLHLSYSQHAFETEAEVIAGEARQTRRDSPARALDQAIHDAAFQVHPYKHTPIGTDRDIAAMPRLYEYSKSFYDLHYRPDNATLVIAGDVTPEEVRALVNKHWAGWQRGTRTRPAIPREPRATRAVYTHVDSPTPTPPTLAIGFRSPGFSDRRVGYAATELLLSHYFGPSSELYKRLVVREQRLLGLGGSTSEMQDPGFATISATLRDPADAVYVRDEILKTLRRATLSPIPRDALARRRAELRYGLERYWSDARSVASSIARRAHASRSVHTIARYLGRVASLRPEQLQRAARRLFRDDQLVMGSLSHGQPFAPELARIPPLASLPPAPLAPPPARPPRPRDLRTVTPVGDVALVKVPARRPGLSVVLRFDVGADQDPPGKEGLAMLAARLVASSGSRWLTTEQLMDATDDIAGGVGTLVLRDQTTFTLGAHRRQWKRFAEVMLPAILEGGFRKQDFERVQQGQLAALERLRGGDETGLAAIRAATNLHAAQPFLGTRASVASITLEDVEAFVRRAYRRSGLVVGAAGPMTPALETDLRRRLAVLPAGEPLPAAGPKGPAAPERLRVELIQKQTDGTSVSLATQLAPRVGSPEHAALSVAIEWLGRGSTGRLYDQIRGRRGLSYGGYAYLTSEGRLTVNVPSVSPANAAFALRLALHEVERLGRRGLTRDQFESVRRTLLNELDFGATDPDNRLDDALSAHVKGTADPGATLRAQLQAMTVEDVNRALRAHLDGKQFEVVMVTPDAPRLRATLLADAPAAVKYATPRAADILAEDQAVGARRLGLAPTDVKLTPIERVY